MSSSLNSTKIFISSTAQKTLRPLRQMLKERLEAAGHLPLLFEENFGLWTVQQGSKSNNDPKIKHQVSSLIATL